MIRLLLKIHRRLPKPLRKLLFNVFSLGSRAMTLGVRIYALNEKAEVLLVRHTYIEGWHLPGGGVERGETVQKAVAKELWEETGLRPASAPQLVHFYKNPSHSKYDHVAFFKCTVSAPDNEFVPNEEIAEIGFFNPDALPNGTTEPTRNRIAEIAAGSIETELW